MGESDGAWGAKALGVRCPQQARADTHVQIRARARACPREAGDGAAQTRSWKREHWSLGLGGRRCRRGPGRGTRTRRVVDVRDARGCVTTGRGVGLQLGRSPLVNFFFSPKKQKQKAGYRIKERNVCCLGACVCVTSVSDPRSADQCCACVTDVQHPRADAAEAGAHRATRGEQTQSHPLWVRGWLRWVWLQLMRRDA